MMDPESAEVGRRMLEEFRSDPVLPWWMDADTQSKIRQLCKEQMGDRRPSGMVYHGPGY
jgi:hypothetical protein